MNIRVGRHGIPLIDSLSDAAASKYGQRYSETVDAVEGVLDRLHARLKQIKRDRARGTLTPRGVGDLRREAGLATLDALDKIEREKLEKPLRDLERDRLPDRVEFVARELKERNLPGDRLAVAEHVSLLAFLRDRYQRIAMGNLGTDGVRFELETAAKEGDTVSLLAVQDVPPRVREELTGLDRSGWRALVALWAQHARPETWASRQAIEEIVNAIRLATSNARIVVGQTTGATRTVPVPTVPK